MNKEKEALLQEILARPDVPRKVSPKNVLRFVDRMQPKTQEMRNYLMAFHSAETRAESRAITETWYAKMTLAERKAFDQAYYDCCMNEFNTYKQVSSTASVKEIVPSV
jgi:hypothetical protein